MLEKMYWKVLEQEKYLRFLISGFIKQEHKISFVHLYKEKLFQNGIHHILNFH